MLQLEYEMAFSTNLHNMCGINEIVKQLARTRVRDQMMGKTTRTSCRLCNQRPETVDTSCRGVLNSLRGYTCGDTVTPLSMY